MKAKVFSTQGEEVRDITLNDDVFGIESSDGTIYYAVNNELANRRVGTACTKTRAEVNYSNAKPWRQKGTGNARSGDKKSPLWVGGGTVFGPKPRDYGYKMPRKMKRLAMRSLLSAKVKEENLKVIEDFTVESGKTRDLAGILRNLVDDNQRTLLVVRQEDAKIRQAGRNIPWLKIHSFNRLSAHELLYGRHVLVLESAAGELNEFYGKK